ALSNSTLAINNFDEGGRDFGGEPPNSANASTPGAPQDNVGATTQVGTNGTSNGFRALRDGQGRTPIVQVYYTLAEGSGSLPFLGSGNASPAHIIYDEDATIPGNEVIYAEASQLGLSPLGDDINALLVFDTVDPPDSFQPGDQVFFSLTPGSISIDGMSGGAATVFAVTAEQPVVPIADASQLGLGPVDDIDSLEFLFCDDAVDCAERFGLRYTEFDMDNDGHVNLADVPLFDSCFTGAGGVFTDPECNRGDGDGDGDVDCDDWDGFLAAWEGPGAPPKSDLCSGIPTVTEWGMVIMTLLMLIAGTLLIGRHRRAVRQA
ncbi:MAG: hypothetical protein GY842_14705, partial [bacterium]|nr:hypothetical protein [bacterium]